MPEGMEFRTLRYSAIHYMWPEQTGLKCVTSACAMDFEVTDNDSDTDSVAELEYKTWDDALLIMIRIRTPSRS